MANQEPLSTSNEASKIHLPNKELVGLKKLWNFLVGKKEEPVFLEEEVQEEEVQTVNHCDAHLRFRKNCLDCLRVVAAI